MTAAAEMPEDIRRTAYSLAGDIRHHIAVSNDELIKHDPVVDAMIAKVLHNERQRCAAVAKNATMMTGAPLEEMGEEVAEAVMLPLKAEKFWMVYGVGQRGSTCQHTSKASAQQEAQRLAELNPGTMFTVLSVVDAYRAAQPSVNRFQIVKRDPVGGKGPDDDIPF